MSIHVIVGLHAQALPFKEGRLGASPIAEAREIKEIKCDSEKEAMQLLVELKSVISNFSSKHKGEQSSPSN